MSDRALTGSLESVKAMIESPVPVSVTGDVKGEAQVKVIVEAGSTLIAAKAAMDAAIMKLNGVIAANGPDSTGKSSPDAGKGARD